MLQKKKKKKKLSSSNLENGRLRMAQRRTKRRTRNNPKITVHVARHVTSGRRVCSRGLRFPRVLRIPGRCGATRRGAVRRRGIRERGVVPRQPRGIFVPRPLTMGKRESAERKGADNPRRKEGGHVAWKKTRFNSEACAGGSRAGGARACAGSRKKRDADKMLAYDDWLGEL